MFTLLVIKSDQCVYFLVCSCIGRYSIVTVKVEWHSSYFEWLSPPSVPCDEWKAESVIVCIVDLGKSHSYPLCNEVDDTICMT